MKVESFITIGAATAGLIGIAFLADPGYMITVMHRKNPQVANWLSHLLNQSRLKEQARNVVRELPADETSDMQAERSYGNLADNILTEFERLQRTEGGGASVHQTLYNSLQATLVKTSHNK